jgi:hypothetical protein
MDAKERARNCLIDYAAAGMIQGYDRKSITLYLNTLDFVVERWSVEVKHAPIEDRMIDVRFGASSLVERLKITLNFKFDHTRPKVRTF